MSKDCGKVRKNLDSYADKELNQKQYGWIENHLRNCGPCMRLFRMIAGLKTRLKRSVVVPQMPSHLRAKVLQSLEAETQCPLSAKWSWNQWLSWLPAQAVAAAVVLGVFLILVGPQTNAAYNFTEISMQAYQRMSNHELMPQPPESEIYLTKYQEAQLPDRPAPSLASMNYDSMGCCFGLKAGHPVAHYLYRDAQGSEISVLLWKCLSKKDRIEGQPRSFEGRGYFVVEQDGVCMVLWKDGEVFGSVFGKEKEPDQLLLLASNVRS